MVNSVSKWTVIGEKVGRKALCRCECGTTRMVDLYTVRTGKSKSCGCSEIKHGYHDTRIYSIWRNMKQRCDNKNNPKSHLYYEKGITYVKEWSEFEPFLAWSLKNGYDEQLTLDRIDGNEGYSPKNCRWTTHKVQANNTSSNAYVTYNGETKTKAQWAEYAGLKYNTFTERLRRGWSIEQALRTPVKKKGVVGT